MTSIQAGFPEERTDFQGALIFQLESTHPKKYLAWYTLANWQVKFSLTHNAKFLEILRLSVPGRNF